MTVVERFLKLVSYPTTSDEASETCPSTARQLALAQELVRQMQDMGIADAHVDQDGYVYGTVPANCDKKSPSMASSPTWTPRPTPPARTSAHASQSLTTAATWC